MPQCFQKSSAAEAFRSVCVWEGVNCLSDILFNKLSALKSSDETIVTARKLKMYFRVKIGNFRLKTEITYYEQFLHFPLCYEK